ncbi:Mitochondrial carrier-like protein 1 [Plecturocebus cupreus]
MSNTLSTVTQGSMKKAFPPDEIEEISNKDDRNTSLKKVVKEASYQMMMQCVSCMLAHPLHVISVRCIVQFVGWGPSTVVCEHMAVNNCGLQAELPAYSGVQILDSLLEVPEYSGSTLLFRWVSSGSCFALK